MSNSLQPHGLQYSRLPCPSPAPGPYSNSCPSNRWCHPTLSSFVVPFSSHFWSFPASGSFPMSQFFATDGQRTGVSASASVLPMNIQDWFPLGWTGWISFLSKRFSRVFLTLEFKSINSSVLSFLYSATLSFTITRSLLKLMSIRLVSPFNHLVLCSPLLLLPSIFPSIRVFSNEPAFLIRWPKYRSFSFSISPSNEYSGLISFRIYRFDLL